MKTDLFTSILAAIIGVLISYFGVNLFIGEIEPYSFPFLSNTVSVDLADPDPEIFNYKALNPTVEVYVGDCDELDEFGQCINVTNLPEDSDDNGNAEE